MFLLIFFQELFFNIIYLDNSCLTNLSRSGVYCIESDVFINTLMESIILLHQKIEGELKHFIVTRRITTSFSDFILYEK